MGEYLEEINISPSEAYDSQLTNNPMNLQSATSAPSHSTKIENRKQKKDFPRKNSSLIYYPDLHLTVQILKIRIFYGYWENS